MQQRGEFLRIELVAILNGGEEGVEFDLAGGVGLGVERLEEAVEAEDEALGTEFTFGEGGGVVGEGGGR